MSFQLRQLHIPYIPSQGSGIWNRDLQFLPGAAYHIRATSGKGKSSFIHTLYGMLGVYKGSAVLDGTELRSKTHDQWCDTRATKLSIVFQDLKLFTGERARDNLEVKRALTDYYPASKIDEFAERLLVSHTLDRRVDTLSYGERQRIAIIRALLQPFDSLLLDEPFSHLDNENIDRASALIEDERRKRHATLILCDLEADTHFTYDEHLFL